MDIAALVANTGGTLGLAIFAIWMLNKVWRDRLEKQEQVTEEMRGLRSETQSCLVASTEAIAANTEVLRANTEAMNANRDISRQLLEVLLAHKGG